MEVEILPGSPIERRGLTGVRPEKDGSEGEETGRRRVVTGRREDEEEGNRKDEAEGRADLSEDKFQTLLKESVGVAIAIGIAIRV